MRLYAYLLWATFCILPSLNAAEEIDSLLLKKAEVMTFYSGSTLHSWYECNAALDSLTEWEARIISGGYDDSVRFERLIKELNVGRENSAANMNGVFPSFGAMTSQRSDYHFIDDAGEVLAEDLVGEFIDMPCQSRKGPYRDNGVFMLMSTSDANLELTNVLIDFLGSETSAYIIRPHELSGVVPCDLEDASCLRAMSADEWNELLTYYDTDEVFLLTMEQKQEFSSDVIYLGLRVERFDSGAKSLVFENYLEGFKTDKTETSTHVIWLLLLGMVVSFLVLTALGLFDYSEGEFFYVRDWQTALHAKKNAFAIVCSAIMVNATFWAAGEMAPVLNEYIWSPSAMLWTAGIIFLPPIIAMIFTYIAMWKFMKDWSVNEMSNYSRLIQSAYLAAYVWFFSSNLVAEPDGKLSYYVLELGLASVFTLSPSWVIGKVIAQIVKGSSRPQQLMMGVFVAVLSWVLLGVAMLFSIANEVELSNWLHIGGFALAVVYLIILPKLSKVESSSTDLAEAEHGFNHPVELMKAGLNWDRVAQDLDTWMETKQSSVFLMRGAAGSGKSRFLREWKASKNQNDPNNWVLFGDFQEVHNDEIVEYEPFVEAVNSLDKTNNSEWVGIFKDTTKSAEWVANTFNKGLETFSGLSLGGAETDENRGVKDIAGRFLKECSNKQSQGISITIILDNYSWATSDEKSRQLFFELERRLRLTPPHRRPLNFILAMDLPGDEKGDAILTKEFEDEEVLITECAVELGWAAEAGDQNSLKKCVEEWLNSIESEHSWKSSGDALRISKKLATHLKRRVYELIGKEGEEIKNIPSTGDLLKYLQLLESAGFVETQGQFIEFLGLPPDANIPIVQGELVENTKRFEALDENSRQFLISAAHTGFKFDAELLAEIWKMDLLHVLRILDNPKVEGVFIRDQSKEDNIYSFINRDIHQRVKSGFVIDGTSNRIRQTIIEFQKRALDHFYRKGDDYMLATDLEVLNSTAFDCIKYLDIESVRSRASKMILVAAYRNFLAGNESAASEFLVAWTDLVLKRRKITPAFDPPTANLRCDLEWLDLMMKALNEGKRNLNLMFKDIQERNALKSFLKLHQEEGGSWCHRVYLDLLEESRLVVDSMEDVQDEQGTLKSDWELWVAQLIADWRPSDELEIELEKDFLLACRKEVVDVATIEIIESKIPDHAFSLKGKVLRKLATISPINRGQLFALRALKHQLKVARVLVEDEELKEDTILEYLEPLREYYGDGKRLDGSDYCFLLSAISKNFPDNEPLQLVVAKYMINAGMKQGVRFTRNLGYNILGLSYIRMNKLEEARSTLIHYGEILLNEGAAAKDFKFVLEPLLKLGKAYPDGDNFSAFMEMKSKMYESLRIISSKLKSEILEGFQSEDFPVELSRVEDQALDAERLERTHDLLELVCRIAIADGELDDNEIYDLSETALACCLHLNLPASQSVLDNMMNQLNGWREELVKDKEMFLEKNRTDFENRVQNVDRVCNDAEKRQVIRLCKILAKSDGTVDSNEQELIDRLEEGLVIS